MFTNKNLPIITELPPEYNMCFLPIKIPLCLPCLLGTIFNSIINSCRGTNHNYLL